MSWVENRKALQRALGCGVDSHRETAREAGLRTVRRPRANLPRPWPTFSASPIPAATGGDDLARFKRQVERPVDVRDECAGLE